MEIRRWKLVLSHCGIMAVGLIGGSRIPALSHKYELYQSQAQIRQQAKEDPENVLNWSSLGVVDSEIGDKENAMGAYRKALSLDSSDYQSLIGIGILYINDKDYESAKSWFTSALQAAQKHNNATYTCQAQIELENLKWVQAHKTM